MLGGRCPDLSRCDGRSYASHHGLIISSSRFHECHPAIRLGAEWRALGSVVERPFGGQYRAACRARVPPDTGRPKDVTDQSRVRRQRPSGEALRRTLVRSAALPTTTIARRCRPTGGECARTERRAFACTDPDAAAAGQAPGRGRRKRDGADQRSAGATAARDAGQARSAGARWNLVCTWPGSVLPAPRRVHILSQGYAESSSRTIFAPALSARSLPRATSRGSGAMPQLVLG
ncbi:Uncharacterised protein [Stenotrophomonas maltophilia]|nr:Uncharacterised protein [Stenotrophomonas maltophilia]